LSLNTEAQEFKLQPFDRIMVRTNPDFEPPQNIDLTGEVVYPGTYAILNKDETVADIIVRAGGLTKFAFSDGVTMNRLNMGTVYLNMEKALKRPNSRFNLVLYDGDQINIPKSLDLVTISGAVGTVDPGNINAPYFGRRANYYVNNFSGGFGSDAKKRKTTVIYPSGIVKSAFGMGIFNIYPKVTRGSKILVVEKEKREKRRDRKPLDMTNVVSAVTGTITTLLTLWVLMDRATQ